MFGQLFWMLDVTDVVVTFGLKPLDVFGRCYYHVVMSWLMFIAIVADVKATLFLFVEDENHIDWCFIDCGRCYNHNMNWLMLLP